VKPLLLSCCYALTSLCALSVHAQKLKTEQITYHYNRLPEIPVKGISNYQVTFEAAYEARNKQALKDYEQQKVAASEKYRADMVMYGRLVKAADERYAQEMADYNKKSLGSKLLEKGLLDTRKPVREQISKPYLEYVSAPVLQSSYDYRIMADTYIKLQGYNNAPANAMKIMVVMYGYDHTMPRNMDQETTGLSFGSGRPSSSKEISYYTEFSYRHPMAVKVYTPDGREVLSLTPPELNSYKIYKSASTDRPTRINSELLIKNAEEKVLQDNLRFINDLLNDKFGFSSVDRVANLYYIKNADSNYADLTTAFNEASSGLLMLQQDAGVAKNKLQKACELWSNALKEADLNNKKARINKDITMGVYFDLLEGYFALGDVQSGQATLDKINGMSLSFDDRRAKLRYDMLFAELKNRQSHN
jgi:hypothetical protein